MPTTDNNHINNLGVFSSLQAVWAAHPEGGRDGDYITINGTQYYWSDRWQQWVTSSSGTPSGTLDDITAAVASLQEAVAALQNSSFATGEDGRLDSTLAPWIVLTFMGTALDEGDNSTGAAVGDVAYRDSDKKIVCVTSGGVRVLGDPVPGLVYCNAKTGKFYRWMYAQGEWGWKRVGNDVINSLESDKTESSLSAYQGMQLSIAISGLSTALTELTSRVDNSIIGEKASSRVVIDVMNYTPPSSGGQAVTVLPGGGYTTGEHASIQAPSGMVGNDMLCYAPTTKKLYYFYKVNNGGAVETRCSIIDPDHRLVYWDASGSVERAMRWNAGTGEWVYNSYYAATETVNTALADKANAADVYAKTATYSQAEIDTALSDYFTKEQLEAAFEAAGGAESVSAAISAITGTLAGEDTSTPGEGSIGT